MNELERLKKLLEKYGVRHEMQGNVIYMPNASTARTMVRVNGQERLTLRRCTGNGNSRVVYASANADYVFLKIDPADAETEGIEARGTPPGFYRHIEYTAEDASASRLTAQETERLRKEREEGRAIYGAWHDTER